MKKLILSAIAVAFCALTWAQSKEDIFNSGTDVTWLGLDFTQLKFIGDAAQWKDVGEISDANMRDKYFPGWNELFVKEQKRYDVAKAINRSEVKYALSVTEKANNSIKKPNFFTDDPNAYSHVTEQQIDGLVKKYDFQGNKGIGMLFFVESMSKGKEEAAMWVTFVDMNKKTVLFTKRLTEKSGGFGFRNYWAKTFNNALKDIDKDLKKWK
ncbi:MAG: hypothetical protein BGO69_10355 [Bacteroidetes bacterium 46-16]|nr:MAG: hypothetical protein BGO69_10355 [Bacteroidetes bacterium 46-16]